MGLTMKKILDKYSDCDTFSLTGGVFDYKVTEEEFFNALNKIEAYKKEENRKRYEKNKDKFINYPEFDELYEEIKQECYEFNSEENRKKFINEVFDDKRIEFYKKSGCSNKEIEKKKENFFRCTFISDKVGETTKYGDENRGFFWHFYHDIAMSIDCRKDKDKYCAKSGKDPIRQVPKDLKKHFLYYEITFSNAVTISGGLMINYYFKLNDETKKYLLNFRNDFCLCELDDLTFYKNNEIKFYSCTHEGFNSIEFNYKEMSLDEISDFINDEYFKENNDEIIEMVNKLIVMENGTKFSFKELGVSSDITMKKIDNVCGKLNLELVSVEEKDNNFAIINENVEFEKINKLPVILCGVEDLIEKKQ